MVEHEIIKTINKDISEIEPYKDLISKEKFSSFEKIKAIYLKDYKSKKEVNRLLKIGIIGQIKRGKSSFLNALLFDGRDILPKGATPMTAALTKIRYAPKPYAKLEFYSIIDWNSIEKQALETKKNQANSDFIGEATEEEKACLEIYEKAEKLDILSFLGKQQTISDVENIEDLLDKLEDYVGADGKYTPIVKSLELGVDIDSIKDIEIIDTPGTNDPVISRGRVTQDFIGECDVVFFLSLSSQFLDQNDMGLLAQNIPKKGVENIYIVGSLFDSAMLDTYNDYESTEDLIKTLKFKYEKRAKEDISKIIISNENGTLGENLRKALPPIFISGMCYNIATNLDDLSEEEQHTLTNLNNMYGDKFSKDDLLFIANIEGVQEKIADVTSKKDDILKSGLANVEEGVKQQMQELKKSFIENVKNDLAMLQNNDIASLEKNQKKIKKNIDKGKLKIDNVFESYQIEIEKKFASLRQSLKNETKNARNIRVQHASETESYSVVSNGFTNWFNDDWGRESRTKTINYKYVDVHEAIGQLEDFTRDSETNIFKTVEHIIDLAKFKKDIMQHVLGLFDIEDDDFDPSTIVNTLKNSVNRISIPNIEIDTSLHINTIRNNFSSSEVKDGEINNLRSEIRKVLDLILIDMEKEIEVQTRDIIAILKKSKKDFLPKLLQDTIGKLESMKKNMEKSEETKKRYEKLLILLSKK